MAEPHRTASGSISEGASHNARKLSTAQVNPYSYTPLAGDNSEIRVLSIYPGDFHEDIYVRLSIMSFECDSAGKYIYEALSYTWGSPENPVEIYVKERQNVWSISVTRNCEEALRYLRCKDKPRTVWIDAICINQQDLIERGRQVSIMRSIYAKTCQVLVWLGSASHDSDVAMQWIDTVGQEIVHDAVTFKPRSLTGDNKRIISTHLIASEAQIEAFVTLLERNYFGRLWVWQEVRMGGEHVRLICGNYETSFQTLMTAARYCTDKPSRPFAAEGRLRPLAESLFTLPLVGIHDSLDSLDRLRVCDCKDQRDRIYTCLAFGDKRTSLELKPDYARSTGDVYSDYVLRHIQVVKSLDFLKYLGDDLHRQGTDTIEGIPSWVPDWSRRNAAFRPRHTFASGNSAPAIVAADNTHLVVRGVRVGNVQRVAAFGLNILDEPTVGDAHQDFCRTMKAIVPAEINREAGLRLTRVLATNEYAEHYVPQQDSVLNSLSQCENYLLHILNNESMESWDEIQLVQRSFINCLGRSLFCTDEGQFGLGPQATQEGDVLAVVLGCGSVMVLRPAGNHYRVVGCAHCTGTMDGEAILGRLPDDHEKVQVRQPSGSYYPGFRNKASGEVTFLDPRLPSLPEEWKDVSHLYPNFPFPYYRNRGNGEGRTYVQDPRLDADALEGRGVELEEFVLF